MRAISIPTPRRTEPFLEQTTALSGQEFGFKFAWNERRELWELSISAEDGTPIATGLAVVHGFDLLSAVSTPGRPQGILICVAENRDAPTLESFETDLLAYVTEVRDE